jgi:hypothetical protein
MKRIAYMSTLGALAIGALSVLSSCTDADIAANNIKAAADNFEVNRRIVFFATTMKGTEYLLTIQGLCSLGNNDPVNELTVTCKDGPGLFKKHFLGLSNGVSYLVEQGEPVRASTYHTRIVFKPQSILPDIDFKGSTSELLSNHNNDG